MMWFVISRVLTLGMIGSGFGYALLTLLFMAAALNLASAADSADHFEMNTGSGTIYAEDRDPFKEGYFSMVIACFCLTFFFIGCLFTVRIFLGNKRGNDSHSFFLVA